MNWASKYVGLEFEDGGRGPEFVDCWGLICLIYRNELGIELPLYSEISPRNLIAVAREMNKPIEFWQSIEREELQEFDIIGMTQYGSSIIAHVGILTPSGKVLHSERGCNTVAIGLDHVAVRERIRCFRRHRQVTFSRSGANRCN